MRNGLPPTILETERSLGAQAGEVCASLQRLAEAHMLVLQKDSGEVLMANPFSAVPTAFLVQVGNRTYFGNCIWDALGIPAMLKQDAVLRCSCGDCGTAMTLRISQGALEPADGIVHFALPAARWWDDIVFN